MGQRLEFLSCGQESLPERTRCKSRPDIGVEGSQVQAEALRGQACPIVVPRTARRPASLEQGEGEQGQMWKCEELG